MKSRSILIITIFGFCQLVYGQMPFKEVAEKIKGYYEEQESYNFNVTYTLYQGESKRKISERYEGSISKAGGINWFDIMDIRMIKFDDLSLVISKPDNTIICNQGGSENEFKNHPLDITNLLAYYKVEKRYEKEEQLVYELVLKSLMFPAPYRKIILYVQQGSYALKKQEMFFATELEFTDKHGNRTAERALLEIVFGPRNDFDNKIPQRTDYLLSGSKIALTSAYSTYKLIDHTQNTGKQ